MSNKFCGSFGINTKVGFAPSGGIDDAFVPATTRVEVLRESLQFSDKLVQGNGITGSINPLASHLRNGQRMVSGSILTEIGPNELQPWIRALCGNTAANSSKDSFDKIAHDFTIQRDLVTHGYRHCLIQQAVIRGRSNAENDNEQIIQLGMNFMGVEEIAGISFPVAVALPTTDKLFWLIGDSALTVAEEDFPIISFEISINNMLQPLFRNRLTPGCFRSLGRDITLSVQVPFSSESSTAMFGENDTNLEVLLSLVSTNLPASASDYSTEFTFPTMRRITKKASTDGRGEIPLAATYRSFQLGSATNMTIVNEVD